MLQKIASRECGLGLVLLALVWSSLAPASAQAPPAATVMRPAAARGTAIVPERFLRRWDPVTVFFTEDQGPLEAASEPTPEDAAERFVRFEPAHPGAFTWLDRRTLQFRPAEPWPPLQRFTWRAGDTRAVLSTLMAPPVSSQPEDGAEGLAPLDRLSLTFPEPLAPAALARMLRIELRPLPGVEGGQAESRWLGSEDLVLKAQERAGRGAPATYVITLEQPIPLGTRAVVHLKLSLDEDLARQGAGEGTFAEIAFETAEPFRAVALGCRQRRYPVTPEGSRYARDQALRCGADRAVLLELSAPPRQVGPVEGRNLLRIEPPVDGLTFEAQDRMVEVRGNFEWETLYRVTLEPPPAGPGGPAPFLDRAGRPLDLRRPSEVWLFFPRQPSYLRWGQSQGLVERFGPRRLPVEGRGQERLDLRLYPVDPLDLSFWPFPEQPVTVDESVRPPGPGEQPDPFTEFARPISPDELAAQILALGSPPVSQLVEIPLRRRSGAALFGLDVEEPLEKLVGEGRPGTYLVGLRRLDRSNERSWMRVQVTDLSLTTVEEPRRVRYAVTSLATGAPVAGARVRLEGVNFSRDTWETFFEGTTDAGGMVSFEAPGYENQSRQVRRLVVEHGSGKETDTLVLDARQTPDGYYDGTWNPAYETWLQWTLENLEGRGPQRETLGHVFTERPVYRPEEAVHVKGYLRERAGGRLEMPKTRGGFVVVEGPGDLVWRYPVELTAAGSFYHRFAEDKRPTGVYNAYFEDAREWRFGSVSFRIEAYRLPRFEVQLAAPQRSPLDRPFKVTATATYYAGGRVAGQPLDWRVTQFPYDWQPKGRPGFIFSSDGRFSRTGRFESSPRLERRDVLDENGSAVLVLDPAVEPTAQPRTYVVEATVTGADDQTVTSTRRILALPPFILGVKIPRYLERARSAVPAVLALGPDDEPLEGLEMTVRLLQRQWHSHLQASDFSDGVARYITDVVDEKVAERKVTSTAGAQDVAFDLPEPGVYIVEVEARDRLGRAQTVAVDFYAGDADASRPVTWARPPEGVFEVTADKERYKPGETASLVLQSPFQKAEALVIVEAPAGNRYQWLPVRGGAATFQLPVEGTFTPRLPVHFVLMRGRVEGSGPLPASATDLGKPTTVAATAWLDVEPTDNRVEVALKHPATALPGKEVEVEITLTTPRGEPLAGEVTLWLVDQAVLALGREQRLDPLPDFLPEVYSHLTVRDTRNLAFGRLPFAEVPGGDEGEEGKGLLDRATVRKNFQPVPFYDPAIQVDASGRKTVRVLLPDNLTNFKVRAKAVSGAQRFGWAAGHLEVRLPVIVQPALPRFVRPGDRFTAAAIGRVVEGEGGAGAAEMRAQGVTVEGSTRRELSWKPDEPQRIEFQVQVPAGAGAVGEDVGGLVNALGEATFQVAVERRADGASDAFEVRLPILPDRDPVVDRQLAELSSGESLELAGPAEAPRPGTLRRSLLLSDQPGLVRMAAGLDFQRRYPYGCTEQRLSEARSYLALRGLRDLLGQQSTFDADLDRAVRETLEWLPSVVDEAGLCAYWPGSRGYVSLTAWVLEFLVEAKNAGYAVDETLRTRLTGALEKALRSDYSRFIDGESWAERTFALRALARAGRFSPAYGAELARKSEFLDLEGVAAVAQAFAEAGETSSAAVGALEKELWDGVVLRLYQGRQIYGGLQRQRAGANGLILPSETRTLSNVTRALSRLEAADPRLPILVQALVGLGEGDGWGSTNANAAALLALSEQLRPPFAGAGSHRLSVGSGGQSTAVQLGPKNPVDRRPLEGTAPVTVRLESSTPGAAGPRPVAVRAETAYVPAPAGSQAAAESKGFVVRRELLLQLGGDRAPERLALEAAGKSLAFEIGQVVEEHVQVVNPQDRNYVAIVVPLAAGFEPLNPHLATAPPEASPRGALTLEPTYVAFLDDHVAFYYNELPKGTYDVYFRTRATTAGSFIQPPARAEAMYDGSVRGQSPGAKIEVSRE